MTLVMDGMTFRGTVDEIAVIVDRLAPRPTVQVTGIPVYKMPSVASPDDHSITIDRRVGDPPGWLNNGPTCVVRVGQ